MVKWPFYHEDDIDKENVLTVDRPLDSADIIDLTFDYSHDDDVNYEKVSGCTRVCNVYINVLNVSLR